MAVFPDRIVLKNSTDDQAAIEAAIQTGGTDEITQGEIVLGILNTDVKFYTKAGDGSIVTLGGTGTGPQNLGDLTDVDLSTPATDGQVIAYNSTSGNWEPVDQSGGGATSLDDLTDVSYTSGSLEPTALDQIVFSSSDVPSGRTYKIYANASYGLSLGAYDNSGGSYFYVHESKGVEARLANSGVFNVSGPSNQTGNTPEIRLNTGNPTTSTPTGNYFGLKLPAGYGTDQTYTVPALDGTNGQVLTTNGAGVLSWTSAAGGGGGLSNVVEDTTPQLGGNLDVNSFYISSASGGDIEIAPDTTGDFIVRGNNTDASITLNCTANTHGVKIQSPPHSDAATYTLILPSSAGTAGQVLTSQGGAQLTWENAGSGGATHINDLTDVDTATTAPTNGQVLTWVDANSQWEPATPSGGSGNLPSATSGDLAIYDGSSWVSRGIATILTGDTTPAPFVYLGFDGSDTQTLVSSGMTTVYPSTDAKFGTYGATFSRASADFLQGVWPSTIGTKQWTLSFWIKTDDNDYAVNTSRRIIAPVSGTNLANGFQVMRESAGGSTYTPHADNAQGAISIIPTGSAASYLCSTRTVNISDNAWHYIVLQHEGSGVYSCFVDGALTERRTATAAVDFADNGGFFIGTRQDKNAQSFFTGSLDEITFLLDYVASTGTTVDVPASASTSIGNGADIGSLSDVDTSTVAPTDGQVLTWVDANSQWEPVTPSGGGGGAVDSVNSQTGVVSLGIQDMDDYALVPENDTLTWSTKVDDGSGGYDFARNADEYSLHESLNRLYINETVGGVDETAKILAMAGETGDMTIDGVTVSGTFSNVIYRGAGAGYSVDFSSSIASLRPLSGAITVTVAAWSSGDVPLAEGDLLKWDGTAEEFRPTSDYISLTTLKAEVAASTDFADFQSRIAAL